MGRFIFDAESDGLLDEVTKIHVIGWYNLDTGGSGTITDVPKMKRFLLQEDLTLIGHNVIRYDIPMFEKVLGIKINARIIDTLPLAWHIYPKREKYGLAFFGEEYGVPKPEVEDWKGQPLEVYVNRVQEDVKINLILFQNILGLLKSLYENDMGQIQRWINYICYKLECAREQEEVRWRLDKDKCEKTLKLFEDEYERKEQSLAESMPKNILYKTLNKPKIMYKKDGSLSARGENWLSLLADLGLDEDYSDPLKLEKARETGNPASHKQLKEWLFELGWEPATYKYEKDKADYRKVRKIPQVSLPRGQGICPSVKLLFEVEPALEELDMLYVIKHRIGLLKGFLRDEVDGYVQAQVAGLTNTLRFKHAVCVNLPGYTGKGDWRDGEHIRGCLIAPEGYVLCGSDMSSLEDRTKQHYMYYFDPDYVEQMNKPGFDPHLDLAIFGYEMTKGEMGMSEKDAEWFKANEKTEDNSNKYLPLNKTRSEFKTVNYGAVYGSGATTMSRTTGMPQNQCTVLLEAYWKKNWSVKEIEKSCITKKINNQMWLFNPVSRFWYSLRALKDRFSTLNQGTGVYCFDRWIHNMRERGLKMCGQFHDEVITPVLNEESEIAKTEKIMRESIVAVNEELKLNRALDIDVQFGNNYAQIH